VSLLLPFCSVLVLFASVSDLSCREKKTGTGALVSLAVRSSVFVTFIHMFISALVLSYAQGMLLAALVLSSIGVANPEPVAWLPARNSQRRQRNSRYSL